MGETPQDKQSAPWRFNVSDYDASHSSSRVFPASKRNDAVCQLPKLSPDSETNWIARASPIPGEKPCTRSAAHVSPTYKLYMKLVLTTMKNTANKIRSKACLFQTSSLWDSGEESRHPWKPCMTFHRLSDFIFTTCSWFPISHTVHTTASEFLH